MDELVPSPTSGSSRTWGEPEFRQLIEKLPAAAYTCDADGLVTYFNPRAVELWGRAPALNDPVDRFCGSFKLFTPDGKPVRHDECWTALALRNEREYGGHEIVIERPDETRVAALAHASPLHDHEGRLIGAVNVLVDITERRRDEDVRNLLAAVVDSSQDAIVSKTLDGRILSWNAGAQQLFGYAAAEAVGRNITFIIPPERLDEERMILDRIGRGERVEHYETVRVARDGRKLDVSLTISPVRDASGRVVGASKVGRDITLQKRAEAALREADRRKSEFLAVLAHELRNPLAPIRTGLQVLRMGADGKLDDEAAGQVLGTMERQLGHLVRLIDDLLDVSRISKGKIELRRERIDLSSAVRDAVEASAPLVAAAGHRLSVELPERPVWVDADRTRLAQVFTNLLNNSARYTEPGGRISLRAAHEDGDAVVTVADTGIGIPAEDLPRVFDLFAQAGRPADGARGGLGVGLSLVRGLVELHGGRVEARSDGPGRGCEFTVRLPASGGHGLTGRDVETAGPAAARPGAGGGLRVLVADDNEDAADSLAILLGLMGHETRVARDGTEAVETAAAFRPHVALVDIGMPRLDGHEVCRRIRAEPWGGAVVLVALTGWGQDDDRRRSVEAGFDYHLVKPVASAALQKVLSAVPAR